MRERAAVAAAIAGGFAALSAAGWWLVAARVAAGPGAPALERPDAGRSPSEVWRTFEWSAPPEEPPRPPPRAAPISWALRDWPLDPPVTHDGLTYPTIQAAVVAAEEGGTIVLRRGVYTRPVSIRGRRDLSLQAGEDGPALLYVPSNRGAAITVEDSHRVTLRDLLVRHDAPPGTCLHAVAARVSRSTDVRLSRVYLGGCARVSLAADHARGLSVADSILEDAAQVAFQGDRLEGDLVVVRSALSSREGAQLAGGGVEPVRLLLSATRLSAGPGGAALDLAGRFEGAIQGNVFVGPVRMPESPRSIAAENQLLRVGPGQDPASTPAPPGADLRWRPPDDFLAAGLDAFSPEVAKLRPGPDLSLLGRSLLLCGRSRPRAFHSVPGGTPMDLTLPACGEIAPKAGDDGVLLHQVLDQREGWIKVRYDVRGEGRRGTVWVANDGELGTACTVEIAGRSIPTGLFHPEVKGFGDGVLQLEGGRTACGEETEVEELLLPEAAAAHWRSAEVRCAHHPAACDG